MQKKPFVPGEHTQMRVFDGLSGFKVTGSFVRQDVGAEVL